MRIVFLGTNGWYDTETGNTVCVLIETKKEFIMLDAGNGFYKIDKYIKSEKPVYLFLSHFHFDHIAGLHILNKFNFRQGINIYGPVGLKKALRDVIKQPYTMPLKNLRTKIMLHELGKKTKLPFNFEFKKLFHTSLCYGYRFYLENKIISYCTDTGLCDNLYLLAKNSDVLITECSYKSGQAVKNWPHLNPEKAALLAEKSNVNKLYLTHFDSSIYKNILDRGKAEITAKKIFRNTIAATDNLTINL
jgi:ribonuclease BN (tRNA processing enzyme)